MPSRFSHALHRRIRIVALAAVIAGAGTIAVAELRPARTLGPQPDGGALLHRPSPADVEFAHRAFDPYRDRPDDTAIGPRHRLALSR